MENRGTSLQESSERRDVFRLRVGQHLRKRYAVSGKVRSNSLRKNWSRLIIKLREFINEAPSQCLLCRQPSTHFHEFQQVGRFLLASSGIHLCDVGIQLVKVRLLLFQIVDEILHIRSVQTAPLEERL